MAKITIPQIQTELDSKGWKVLSTDYQNLDTEMSFECSEGHKVFSTWKKLRTKCECPICKQNTLKENKPVILEKKKGVRRVLALDQSSHITGWAVFDGSQLIKYGTYIAQTEDEAARLHEIKEWVMSMVSNWVPDIIAIEGIQYQQNFGVVTFQILARLQGVLMEMCYGLNIPCKVCPTNTWRAHCGVKGKQRSDKKRSMQMLVKEWFDISVSDDESDAIGIGKYTAETARKQLEIVNWE